MNLLGSGRLNWVLDGERPSMLRLVICENRDFTFRRWEKKKMMMMMTRLVFVSKKFQFLLLSGHRTQMVNSRTLFGLCATSIIYLLIPWCIMLRIYSCTILLVLFNFESKVLLYIDVCPSVVYLVCSYAAICEINDIHRKCARKLESDDRSQRYMKENWKPAN